MHFVFGRLADRVWSCDKNVSYNITVFDSNGQIWIWFKSRLTHISCHPHSHQTVLASGMQQASWRRPSSQDGFPLGWLSLLVHRTSSVGLGSWRKSVWFDSTYSFDISSAIFSVKNFVFMISTSASVTSFSINVMSCWSQGTSKSKLAKVTNGYLLSASVLSPFDCWIFAIVFFILNSSSVSCFSSAFFTSLKARLYSLLFGMFSFLQMTSMIWPMVLELSTRSVVTLKSRVCTRRRRFAFLYSRTSYIIKITLQFVNSNKPYL